MTTPAGRSEDRQVNPLAQTALSGSMSVGAQLLTQLKQAHDALLTELDAMDEVHAERTPDFNHYTTVRWRLTKASRARRTIIEQAVTKLRERASPADLAVLTKLRAEDIEAVRRSSEHVYRWTAEAVRQEWASYRQASATVRASMRARIRLEQESLIPLLARY